MQPAMNASQSLQKTCRLRGVRIPAPAPHRPASAGTTGAAFARGPIQLMQEEDVYEEAFQPHVAEATNIKAKDGDQYRTLRGYSGDGKTLKSLLAARPDKIQSDRLFRILNFLVKDVVGGRNKGIHQFDCAEPHAVAQQTGFNVPLENIRITSIKVAKGYKAGQTRYPCDNCSQWLEWSDSEDSYKIRKEMLDRSWRDRYRIGMGRMSGETLKNSLNL